MRELEGSLKAYRIRLFYTIKEEPSNRDMIPEDVWNEIKKVIPQKQPGSVGRPASDEWRILSGVLFVVHAGIQWKYLSEMYAPQVLFMVA